DCQLACPWNKYARRALLPDFDARSWLAEASLLELWGWTEAEFLQRTEGNPIRRIGWQRWRRNLAVGLGNALRASGDPGIATALAAAREAEGELVREHIDWALAQGEVQTSGPDAGVA
ncbi:MAG TPA: tRNA epoxyqueuosine(34) reductase QueG, partial [Rubrivivax sp.]|nr:tRNA epoxyqueuosine(34) reductase QueG [Rubrivivax sp.]